MVGHDISSPPIWRRMRCTRESKHVGKGAGAKEGASLGGKMGVTETHAVHADTITERLLTPMHALHQCLWHTSCGRWACMRPRQVHAFPGSVARQRREPVQVQARAVRKSEH